MGGCMPKARKKRKKKVLTADEKKKRRIQQTHIREIRSIFSTTGFSRISGASNKEFQFEGTTSDFDDLFLFENILVFVEYTTAQQSDISSHLKKKKIVYDKIAKDPSAFVEFLDNNL